MLFKLANRAGMEMAVTDQDGKPQVFKLLNTQYLGIRKLHTDVQGVTPPYSGIVNGSVLYLPGGESLTVSMVTADYYKGKLIRNAIDLVENNNKVTVVRQEMKYNNQGGINGKMDILVHKAVPVKIGNVLQIRDDKNDTTLSQFGMLLSIKFPVKVGDQLIFDTHYDVAKVEAIKLNYEGIYEITFDKEPRWT